MMDKKRNVLLVTSAAPSQSPFSTTEKRPPVGIGFLISILRNAGHNVFFIDNYLKPSNFLETDYLQRNDIDFVGIYANTICYRDTLRMLCRLDQMRRSGKWSGKIIVGGPHATVALDTIPGFVDHVVQGEGEQAILDIVDNKVSEREVRYPRIRNLNELPMPAWDFFVHMPYNWGVDWFDEKPVFTMNTSRGCPFQCSFCSVGSIWGKQYTYFSAERIVEEIEFLVERYGAKGIYFREDNFTLNRKRLIAFCNLLIKKGIKIYWACESRVNTLDDKLVDLMYRAGVRAFYFGVESGSQRVLDFLRKGITVEQIRDAFALCHRYGIKAAASIIVGTPTETEEELRQTEALIREIKPTVTWHNVFVGIPNSELYRYAINKKLYEFIDDRKLVYLKGHNSRVKRFYGNAWDATVPFCKNNPTISVVMSVYNGAAYLEDAINSILKQTYPNFEFIIFDDASTDATPVVLRKIDDPRIRIIRNSENFGLTRSLNMGIKQAVGKYIARMDADDLSHPLRFEKQVAYLDAHSECLAVGTWTGVIREDGQQYDLWKTNIDAAGLMVSNAIVHGSAMIRKSALQKVGGYDEQFQYAQDYDLWLRMSEAGVLKNLQDELYYWRYRKESVSIARKDEQNRFAALARELALDRRKQSVQKRNPLVSVIVPTYNRPAMLVEAIQSILEQTYKNIEIIVVNDAGTDVRDVIRDLNQRNDITYIEHSGNQGLAAARNSGLRIARGEYIAYLDDDDIYYPDHIETLVVFLETGDYKVAYTDASRAFQKKKNSGYVITKRDIPYSFDFDPSRILCENFIPVLCIMHHKSCIDEVGQFDPYLRRTEDWDLWIRMSRKFPFAHIKRVTCEFRWKTDGGTMMTGEREPFAWAALNMFFKYKDFVAGNPAVGRVHNQIVGGSLDILTKAVKTGLKTHAADTYKRFQGGEIETVLSRLNYLSRHYDQLKSSIHELMELLSIQKQHLEAVRGGAHGAMTPLSQSNEQAARLLAFYLPQFHPIPENDKWWGKGFTEWTNVAKAQSMFPGHYQPHLPSELGFYDLRLPEVREAQAELAREYGIYGFCYYHYWFNGKRLLNLPIDEVLSTKKPDFPFCLCWANENWTRAWDGHQGEILMKQEFSEEDDKSHIQWLLKIFQDKRYIRINHKPLMIVYLATRLPNPSRTAEIWREEAKKVGEELYICKVESAPYECGDPSLIGFDACIEFQPDWGNLGPFERKLENGHVVFDYPTIVKRMLNKKIPEYKRYPCVTPMWDNSPRRKQAAVIINNSTPAAYAKWLSTVTQNIEKYNIDEPFVFINAWNEWGEGNHLEPDIKFGKGYLEATKHALLEEPSKESYLKNNLVSIVVLTYNQLRFTKECIESIRKHTPEPHEIIFVDNSSTDGTVKWLRKLVKRNSHYKVIENKKNLGFSRGCNQGIEASTGEYILLLNNDVVVTENWLAGMLECVNSAPDIGIVGPMTNCISGPQRVPEAGYSSIDDLAAYARKFREKNRHRRIPCRRVVGFCMLFNRQLIAEIGLLDESFGSGNFEDDDFCLRAFLTGHKNVIAGDVFIHHYGSRTFAGNRMNYGSSLSGNRKIFTEKWSGMDAVKQFGKKLQIENAITQADEFCRKGDIEKATASLLEAMKQTPDDRRLYFSLAEMLIDSKRYSDALGILESLPQGIADTKQLSLMGYCEQGLGHEAKAEEYADRALALEPSMPQALNIKGVVAYHKGEKDNAESLFKKAMESVPSLGESYTNLGSLKWAAGEHAEALHLFERGFILSPMVSDVVTAYHSAVADIGTFARAMVVFREARALYPNDKRIAFLLIAMLIQEGKNELAMKEIEQAMMQFGIDDGILSAGLEIRRKIGPHETAEAGRNSGTLSLCMIVKNEEQHLPRCLMSVKPIVNEILVVDTGSTDRTKNIAMVFGAKVFDFAWTNDFSEARNYSLSKASGDYILVLDADEMISPLDHASLRLLIKKVKGRVAYSMTTRNYTHQVASQNWTANDGKYLQEEAGSGWVPSPKVRLYVNDKCIRFSNPVHELVEPALRENGIHIKSCGIPVHHYGRLDQDRVIAKGTEYYWLGKKKVLETNGDYQALRELAIQASEIGKYEEALPLWENLLKQNPKDPLVYLNLGYAHIRLSRYDQGLIYSRKALELDPNSKESGLNYAGCELIIGDVEKAIFILDRLLQKNSDYPPALARLAAAYIIAGRREDGLRCLERLRTHRFDCTGILSEQARAFLSQSKFEKAIVLLETAIETQNINTDTHLLLAECRRQKEGHVFSGVLGSSEKESILEQHA